MRKANSLDGSAPGAVVLQLCATCPGKGADALQAALERAGFDVPVRLSFQSCMNGCSDPVSLALQGPGRATYFFGGIDPEADCADIIATLHAYLAADAGWIENATACGRLRFCLKGRVPALVQSGRVSRPGAP